MTKKRNMSSELVAAAPSVIIFLAPNRHPAKIVIAPDKDKDFTDSMRSHFLSLSFRIDRKECQSMQLLALANH